MRFVEVVLSVADVLAFLVLVIPQLHALRWAGYAAPVALAAAAAQALIEGPRWQMAPAYGLALVLCLIWLAGMALPGGLHVHRVVSILGTGVGALLLIIAVALPILLPVFQFPKPGGPYAIGTASYHWTDTSRPELFSADPADHREIIAQVWYPAKDQPNAPRAPYIEDADAVTPYVAGLIHAPAFLLSHFRYVTTHAVETAPAADDQPSYPVLIYLTGLGGFRQVSMFQIEALVSHGYIVVGLDQPGGSANVRFPDGREIVGPGRGLSPLVDQSGAPQTPTPELNGKPMPEGIIPYFAQDASFALDELAKLNQSDPKGLLTGRLDLDRTGMFGISLGAIVGSQLCATDPRVKACLMMDAFVTAEALKIGIKQPSMFITRPADTMRLERAKSGGWAESDIAITLDTMKAAYAALPGEGYYIDMPTMFHINFTDAPYWSPILSQVGMTGPIDGQRGFDIVNAYSIAFFDKELKGKTSPLLEGQTFPEAHIDIRRP